MKTPDRTKQPDIKLIEKTALITPGEQILDNGAPMYYFNTGTQDVVKVECVFDAGTWYQDKKLVAFSTVKMLTEGTKKHNAGELAEIFDSYGAYVSVEAEKDYTYVTLYSLTRHLENVLPVFTEMLRESVFPAHELNVLLSNTRQDFMVSMERVNFVSRIKFSEQLFGAKHPYGQTANPDDYDKVTPDDLKKFYATYYHPGNMRIIAAGRIDDRARELINKYLGDKSWKATEKTEVKNFPLIATTDKKQVIVKENALQSGVRIGKILFTKAHPDYFGMSILNCILGGYFGSRLMTNIREDKGYTYGIGSGMLSMRHEGYFFVASEVGADVREQAVVEIYKEIEKLRTELVSEDELSLVKSYMAGSFLRSIDGPFALSDRFLGLLDYGVDFNEYYNRYVKTIKDITPERLLELANKYFAEDSFCETVAGK